MIEKICPICGKKFYTHKSDKDRRFCSRKCYFEHYRGKNHPKYKEKVKLICPECGKEFSIYPAWARKGWKFCSKKCRAAWMRKHFKHERNPNFKGGDIELTCQWCGEKFKVYRWWTFRKFCSKECYNSARRFRQGVKARRATYICDYCGKTFYLKRRIKSNHRFCSNKCKAKWQSQHFTGTNNPFYQRKHSSETLTKIIKSRINKPNRSERTLINILNENNLPFRYVGNGEIIIGGKNPDFIHSGGQKKVIELFGIYWHSPLYGKVRSTMTYEAIMKHYAKYGYECLVLWDSQLKNKKLIIDKITEFIGGIKVAPNIMVE